MPRMRTLKPSFFTNERLAEISPLGRLLFAGLWGLADREGRLEDRPKRIKAEVLPYDNANVDRLLADLAEGGFIVRYEVDGARFLQVENFVKHQQPHYKEIASIIPAPPGHVDSGKTAGGVSESVRQRVFDRDGRKCVNCGATDDLSLDHIKPRAAGGGHDESNLQTLCGRCNAAKGRRDVESTSVQGRPDVESTESHLAPLDPGSGIRDPDPGSRSGDPDPVVEQQPVPTPQRFAVVERDPVWSRLCAVHRELTKRLHPPATEEQQFDAWVADGATEADIDAALAQIRGWDTPPERPWPAFREALGSRLASRAIGGSNGTHGGAGEGTAARAGAHAGADRRGGVRAVSPRGDARSRGGFDPLSEFGDYPPGTILPAEDGGADAG